MKRGVQEAGLAAAFLLIYAAISVKVPEFRTLDNVENLVRQSIVVGIAAIGMTLIIARGAIDLSVGSIVALITVVTAKTINAAGPGAAVAAAIVVGIAAGTINGLLTAWLKVGAFIVTLAGLLAYRGLAKGLADNSTINTSSNWISSLTQRLGDNQKWMILPTGAWLMIALAVLVAFMMSSTIFGRRIIATGSNENTAQLCGIDPNRMTVGVFALAGALFGIAGLVQYARLNTGDPTVAGGLELTTIAAVVIGGASLSGGSGSILGTILGVLIMQTIATGSSQMGLPNWIQEIITGLIIVAAVAYDRWRARRMNASV